MCRSVFCPFRNVVITHERQRDGFGSGKHNWGSRVVHQFDCCFQKLSPSTRDLCLKLSYQTGELGDSCIYGRAVHLNTPFSIYPKFLFKSIPWKRHNNRHNGLCVLHKGHRFHLWYMPGHLGSPLWFLLGPKICSRFPTPSLLCASRYSSTFQFSQIVLELVRFTTERMNVAICRFGTSLLRIPIIDRS